MITFADSSHYKGISALFKSCFGIEQDYMKYYFGALLPLGKNLIKIVDGKPVSTLTLFPGEMKGGKYHHKIFYVFSVGTDPEYRKRGYMGELLDAASQYAASQGYYALVLTPAEPSLFEVYGKHYFFSVFNINKTPITAEQMKEIYVPDNDIFTPVAKASELTSVMEKIRHKTANLYFGPQLNSYILYDVKESNGCAFAKKEKGKEALVVSFGRKNGDGVVREFDVPDHLQIKALSRLYDSAPANRYMFLTPANKKIADFKAYTVPYAMARPVVKEGVEFLKSLVSEKIPPVFSPLID